MKRLTRCWLVWAASLCVLGLLIQNCSSAGLINQQFTPPQIAKMNGAIIRNETGNTDKEARHAPAAGDVMIAGGIKGAQSTSQVQFYSFIGKKFSKTGALAIDRAAPCGLTLLVGPSSDSLPLFVAGGAQVSAQTKGSISLTMTTLNETEEYGRDTGKFAASASMNQPRVGCTATTFNDGTVLITGGLDASGNPQDTAEIFDPATIPPTFTPTSGNMISPRAFHTATLLTTGPYAGDVLITGGLANNSNSSSLQGQTLNTAELYHPSTGTFTSISSPMSASRAFHTATQLNDGTILIAGGDNDQASGGPFGATAAADIFDPTTQTFTATAGPLMEPLLLHGATLLSDGTGRVLITGGFDVSQIVISSSGSIGSFVGTVAQGAELYDPLSKTFSCIGGPVTITINNTNQTVCASVMKHPHAGHAAVLLDDGTVLVAGGFGGKKITSNATTTKVAEIYHPTKNTFTKVGSMKPGVALGAVSLPLGQEYP